MHNFLCFTLYPLFNPGCLLIKNTPEKMPNRLFPENHYTDQMIWDSFKNGDKEALGILYYRYFRILIQNCFRYSKDVNLIEDCIHDLFLEIWHNKVNLITPESVKAYLLCSTQRKVLRQVKKGRNLLQPASGEFHGEIVHSIEEIIISEQNNKESKKEITRALNNLSKRQKEAVCFRYYDNLSYSEISCKMEISTDSVYNLVSKALDNIQKCLQKKSRPTNTWLN